MCNILDIFNAYLLPTPNLTVHGECLLEITGREVNLFAADDTQRLVAKWPLSKLRRYGRDGTKFTIEAGRFVKQFCLHIYNFDNIRTIKYTEVP